jgi:hypothetical protein
LVKEDERVIAAEEVAQFMVIEFDRNDKRILLSHTRLWEQEKEEEKQIEMKEKKAEFEQTKKAVKNIQAKVEKSTLGDLGVLAGLKAKMDGDSANAASETPAAEAPAVEAPAVEAPAVEAPAVETPVVEAPAVETPAAEETPEAPAAEATSEETPAAE